MRSLNLSNDAEKVVRKLEDKQFRQVTIRILELRENPRPHDSIELKSAPGVFRFDTGAYRICYRFDEKTVYILVIGRRNDDDVYSTMKRKK